MSVGLGCMFWKGNNGHANVQKLSRILYSLKLSLNIRSSFALKVRSSSILGYVTCTHDWFRNDCIVFILWPVKFPKLTLNVVPKTDVAVNTGNRLLFLHNNERKCRSGFSSRLPELDRHFPRIALHVQSISGEFGEAWMNGSVPVWLPVPATRFVNEGLARAASAPRSVVPAIVVLTRARPTVESWRYENFNSCSSVPQFQLTLVSVKLID